MSRRPVKGPPREDRRIRVSLLSYYSSQTTSQATILLTIVLVAVGALQLNIDRLPALVTNAVLSVLAAAAVRSLLRILYWGALATSIQNVRPASGRKYQSLTLFSRYQYGAINEVKGETWKEEGRDAGRTSKLEAWFFARPWIQIVIVAVACLGTFALLQYLAAISNLLSKI